MSQSDRLPIIALVCGGLAVIAAFIAFWMVFISVGLGIAAIVLGVRIRGRYTGDVGRDSRDVKARELASAAIALGIVGILGTGGSFLVSQGAEEYGRDCALNPSPDC